MNWIPVSEKLPEYGKFVLITDKDGDMYVATIQKGKEHSYWIINCRCREGSEPYYITHWMPLPSPPEDK